MLKKKVTRREFIALAGGVSLAAAVSSMNPMKFLEIRKQDREDNSYGNSFYGGRKG